MRSASDGTGEFRWIDGTRLRVEPNTEITIRYCSMNLKRHAQNSEFNLSRGKVYVRIPQKLGTSSRFAIVTPSATTCVRGTIFSVSSRDRKTEVAVWKGSVEVSKDAQTTFVPAGEMLSANENVWQAFDAHSPSARDATRSFQSLTSIIFPSLKAHLRHDSLRRSPNSRQFAKTLIGQAEAGDRVFLDAKEIFVRGDGGFAQRVALENGDKTHVLTAIDRHGARRVLQLRFTTPPTS